MASKLADILDAAEARIRVAGYHGVSFRDVAADVGIKSASVHYHFPTKADLAAAVARRYRQRFLAAVREAQIGGMPVAAAWEAQFRKALTEDGKMCLCGVLAAEAASLPEPVRHEAQHFFEDGLAVLDKAHPGQGAALLARLEGALLLARACGRTELFDQAMCPAA